MTKSGVLSFGEPAMAHLVSQNLNDIRHAALANTKCGMSAHTAGLAAHARAEGWILVTNNTREFSRVPGLQLENWAEDMSTERNGG